MRPLGRAFVERTIKIHTPVDPVYEFGSFRVPGQEQLADLRPLFKGYTFVGTDLRPGPGVDLLIDIEKIPLANNSIGTAICIDTLEHVQDVKRAVEELHRILKPGGLIIIGSVMFFPIHEHPSDYWRFTPFAFKYLLRQFSYIDTAYDGTPAFPTGVYGWGIK